MSSFREGVGYEALQERPRQSPFFVLKETCTFDVSCGSAYLARNLIAALDGSNTNYDPKAPIKLILDAPLGYAFEFIEALRTAHSNSDFCLIVVTLSACAEYLQDLSDLGPDILLDGVKSTPDLEEVLLDASRGARYSTVLTSSTPLNPTERQIFWYIVRGYSNKAIAVQLSLQQKTIMNLLTSIYGKLGINSRGEAILHYWGLRNSQVIGP